VEEVYESYRNYMAKRVETDPTNGMTKPISALSADELELKSVYEDNLLHSIYYHNPHVPRSADDNWEGTAHCHGCIATPRTTKNTIFFIGFLNMKTLSDAMLPAKLDESTTHYWDALFNYPQFPMGKIPEDHMDLLTKDWDKPCAGPRDYFLGVSVAYPKTNRYMETKVNCPHDLRYEETEALPASSFIKGDKNDIPGISNFVFVFDSTEWVMQERGLNILQTFFIIIVLAGGAAMFSKDANTLVLGPVERMITKLNIIRKNPFEAIKMSEEELRKDHAKQALIRKSNAPENGRKQAALSEDEVIALQSVQGNRKKKRTFGDKLHDFSDWLSQKRKPASQPSNKLMETVVLEKTIIKLGGLCALAFGEAGSNVIAMNMKESDTTSAINTMIEGAIVDGVYGFCDIRNFTDATEILQDGVMLFVNQIGEIVHTLVDQHCGSPNKNIGDAFLLVWRLAGKSKADCERICELSILAFVKVIAATNKSPVLAQYRLHDGLIARMPNYRVRMGFGLHRGDSIEGAIGSEFKVDASYLSPGVNLSADL